MLTPHTVTSRREVRAQDELALETARLEGAGMGARSFGPLTLLLHALPMMEYSTFCTAFGLGPATLRSGA